MVAIQLLISNGPHVKDRRNFYEMEMSSTRRYVMVYTAYCVKSQRTKEKINKKKSESAN
jgi:hypothetical protein